MKTTNEMSCCKSTTTLRKEFLHESKTNMLISTSAKKGDTVEEVFFLATPIILGQFQK